MKKINIAIDGYSSTGKSTIAKQLAIKLGYIYVDTGAMYRAVTLYAMKSNYISSNNLKQDLLIADLDKINLNFKFNKDLGFAEMYLNDKIVEKQIRNIEVSNFVSAVAELSEVRVKLVEQQKRMGKNKGVVMDGRDIGTVVFPNAELKIFMTASADIRTERRYEELIANGDKVSFNEVKQNTELRDKIDTTRSDSPLIQAKDAILFDNSNLTKTEQFNKILELAKKKIKEPI